MFTELCRHLAPLPPLPEPCCSFRQVASVHKLSFWTWVAILTVHFTPPKINSWRLLLIKTQTSLWFKFPRISSDPLLSCSSPKGHIIGAVVATGPETDPALPTTTGSLVLPFLLGFPGQLWRVSKKTCFMILWLYLRTQKGGSLLCITFFLQNLRVLMTALLVRCPTETSCHESWASHHSAQGWS